MAGGSASSAPERPAVQVVAAHTVATREPVIQVRRGWVRRLVSGVGDSCVLAGVALLGCLAVIAVGAAGSLVWALLTER
jgi:type IV secretory pathway TrbF-like protein